MNGDDIRHIMKKHGDAQTEQRRGQIAITPDDIARIPEITSAPDRIHLSEETDGKGRNAIIFEKQIGDQYITIQGVSDGKRLLQADTLYKRRTRTTRDTMPGIQEDTVPVINAQGEPPQSSSDLNIAQTPPESNLQQAGSRSETSPALRALDDALSRRRRVPTSEAAALLSRTSRRRRLTPSIPLWSG